MFKIIQNINSLIKTLFCFGIACFIIPLLIISFICVHFSNKFWIYCLTKNYPQYEFSKSKKIRSLIDTTRNAAIFHFLLEINGICDFNQIKEHYIQNLIEKRNKIGELKYLKLRKKLISCWGNYAWVKDDSDFNIDKHIVLSNKTYRGRPVTEDNLQDFISDLITKYLPPEIPPWQVIVIPIITPKSISTIKESTFSPLLAPLSSTSNSETTEEAEIVNEKYYILVRIHHLLLADENNLHVSELLMLNNDKSSSFKILQSTLSGIPLEITSTATATSHDDEENHEDLFELSKLSNFIKRPKHIPNLWNHILVTASNRWNEFIYHYDPLESPDVDKKQQIKCLSQLISILFIMIVTIILDFIKGYKKTNNQIKYKLKYFLNIYKREIYKRNLTTQAVIDSILFSLNPLNITKNVIKYFWWFSITLLLLWPFYIYCELCAVKELIFKGHTNLSNTLIGFLSIYFPLIYNAVVELYHIIIEIIKTPRNIYDELFANRTKEGNILQIKSYCGRKVISFSKSINMNTIRDRIENFDEIGEIEFLLGCLSCSLYNYLQEYRDHRTPSMLNVTCRSIEKKYFIEKYNKTAHIGGVVFLQIPLCKKPNIKQFSYIKHIIERVHKKQLSLYLLSIGQVKYELLTSLFPQVWMKIFINYFSINFPVTITEIHGDSSKMEVNWGQKVNDLLFFRPPQSKTCLSLNLHRFGNKTRLAVMADTQLAPDHVKISSNWENYVETTNL